MDFYLDISVDFFVLEGKCNIFIEFVMLFHNELR